MAYYDTASNYGNYRFVTLKDIINNFNMMYVGEDKLITRASRVDILFHAKRGLAELSYDVLKSFKAQEVVVPNTLSIPLPHDYVNYRAVTLVGTDGIEKNLYPTGKTSNPFKVLQNADGSYDLTVDDPATPEVVEPIGELQEDPNGSTLHDNWKTRTYADFDNDDSTENYFIDADGRRYGLDPQHAHQHGSFFIDYGKGTMHFGSRLAGETIVLHYVSDGLGDESEMVVHKFAEEAIYKWISHGILSSKSNVPEGLVQRVKKERFAEVRKAKIRLSNIKMEEFTQILKGKSKPIK
jgi:hypothetical protein